MSYSTYCVAQSSQTQPQYQNIQGVLQTLRRCNIEVVAPASGVDLAVLNDIKAAFPFKINIANNLISLSEKFCSNSDSYRLNHLKKALNFDVESLVIWCLRGGYGSARIMDSLIGMPQPKFQKIFIGYSDATALHLFLSQNFGWQTVHGAFVIDALNNSKDLANLSMLADLISGKISEVTIPNLEPLNNEAKRRDVISGKLTGGNLSVIQTSIGTKWEILSNSKILFLEDWNEPGYKVDRMLTHLKSAGVFQGARAVIFGDFNAAKHNPEVDYVLLRFASDIKIPVYKTHKFGHGKYNYPIVYNADATIENKNAKFQLYYTTALRN